MLFFVDESWQEIGGVRVGSLGCLAIPAAEYNRFCRVVYKIKHDELGARQLQEKELKGNTNFCKAAFKAEEVLGQSPSLIAVERVLDALHECDASIIALTTIAPVKLSIRDGESMLLTEPYVDLVLRMYALMKSHRGQRGMLFFDQLGHREDQRAACAVQNFFVRTTLRYSLSKLFIQVPHFTHSSVSPGLQVADLVAYLCAHTVDDFAVRPELRPWWEAFADMSFRARIRKEERDSVSPFVERPEFATVVSDAIIDLEQDLEQEDADPSSRDLDIGVTGEP